MVAFFVSAQLVIYLTYSSKGLSNGQNIQAVDLPQNQSTKSN